MALIKGRGNKTTELALVTAFRELKVTGWRRHVSLPGRPDFTFPQAKVCVFVHGCFWHGCPHCYRSPATNKEFWRKKVGVNRRRDRRVARQLRARGFAVVTVWECQLSGKKRAAAARRVQGAVARRKSSA